MPENAKRYYITTPIYYVNGLPHVGTATTTILADATKRYHRLRGEDAYFLTGTDENARKVTDAAAKAGREPQAFVDELAGKFMQTWKYLGCDYDVFFRTTGDRHRFVVQEVFRRLKENGDVYAGTYEGWYSVADETFFRDTDVDEATQTAKETGAKVERVQEETYFFRLSAYGDRLKKHILDNPTFLLPETRRNEVLAFIDQGLRDIAITQNRSGWGIPVPGEEGKKVIYVWFDALINYLTASGWPDAGWETLWPADVHLMAKEIYTRFHATLWPAMLMALGLPVPRHVVGHGWWLIAGEKGAKSKGNIPLPEDEVARLRELSGADEAICVDALRYYILRDIRWTDDSDYSFEMLVTRFNADLANDLGNVLNRVLRATYYGGTVPAARALDPGLRASAESAVAGYEAALERFDWGAALQSAWTLISAVNNYLQEKAPWLLAKSGDTAGVEDAVYNALEGVRLAALMASPALPHATREMARQLGLTDFAADGSWEAAKQFGYLKPGTPTGEPTPLFPRIDTKKQAAQKQQNAQQAALKKEKKDVSETPVATAAAETAPVSDTITIDDFLKVKLRVAEIVAAERIEGANKLLRLQLKIGDEERQIVSGIADAYQPEEIVGRKIVVVVNLLPRKMRGVESQGMLLAATDAEGRAVLLHPDKDIPSGAEVR
ncbi:MAG TPA: methionine--tRNA ligase [Armatimonadaceae bacterium]|nr:methionine--tRNA ligase [Armatimonadaceae bacterium]